MLDATYPIRRLCHYDCSITSAGSFATLKQFNNVELYRLKTYGGRYSMQKRFKDRSMAKEVAQVVKTIDPSEPILCFVFKKQSGSGVDHQHILREELDKAGIDLDATITEGRPVSRLQPGAWRLH